MKQLERLATKAEKEQKVQEGKVKKVTCMHVHTQTYAGQRFDVHFELWIFSIENIQYLNVQLGYFLFVLDAARLAKRFFCLHHQKPSVQ